MVTIYILRLERASTDSWLEVPLEVSGNIHKEVDIFVDTMYPGWELVTYWPTSEHLTFED